MRSIKKWICSIKKLCECKKAAARVRQTVMMKENWTLAPHPKYMSYHNYVCRLVRSRASVSIRYFSATSTALIDSKRSYLDWCGIYPDIKDNHRSSFLFIRSSTWCGNLMCWK